MHRCDAITLLGGFPCTHPQGHDTGTRATPHDSCTWHVESVLDKGPRAAYRFHVQGRIVQGGTTEPDQPFSWGVSSLDDDRYVLDGAHAR